jgi:hypothetical protein
VLRYKREVFANGRGNGLKYFNAVTLFNESGTGYMQRIAKSEDYIFSSFTEHMERWRKTGVNLKELNAFYIDIYPKIESAYR